MFGAADPDFLSVDDIFVANPPGEGADTRGVGPGGGFGNAERLQAVQTSLDGALDRMSFLRTKVGEELNSTDAAFASNSQLELQTESRRSDLRDLDYAGAVSDMQVNQTALQAALKSYANFARLSLFDSLN